jgi:glycerol kinase
MRNISPFLQFYQQNWALLLCMSTQHTPAGPTQDDRPDLTLVMDQGSHASRLALFTPTGELLQIDSQAIHSHTRGQFIEQDADDILQSLKQLLHQLTPQLLRRISHSGICTQRSTLVAWDRHSGKALSPAISWRDQRGQAQVEQLRRQGFQSEIHQLSGLPLSAHYAASKIHWLLEHNPRVQQARQAQTLCITPLASYLLFHLLQQAPCVIDHSNAQRTQLMDIQHLNWSARLLQLFQLPADILPALRPMLADYGRLKLADIPLYAACGDQNALPAAYPPLASSDCLVNVGTGAFILSPQSEKQPTQRLLRSLCYSDAQQANFLSEGTVKGAGAALDWLSQQLPQASLFEQLPRWLAEIRDPPLFINTLAGLGSPWWCDAGEAEFIDSGKLSAPQKYAALVESIVFLISHNLQQLAQPPQHILISGGLSQLDGLCQKLSDLNQALVVRFAQSEGSARGCANLANQLAPHGNSRWRHLPVQQRFTPQQNHGLAQRYTHFVGELRKRCRSD